MSAKIHFMLRPCPLLIKTGKDKAASFASPQAKIMDFLEKKDCALFFKEIKKLPGESKLTVFNAAFYFQNNDIRMLNSYASELNRQKKYGEAWDLLNSLNSDNWDNHIYNTAAAALNGPGRYSEAYALLNSLGRNNWDPHLYNTAAIALNGLGRYSEAQSLLNSLDKDKWNPQIYNSAASTLIDMGKHQEAFLLLNSLDRNNWDNHIYNTAAAALNGLGRYGEAYELLNSLVRNKRDKHIYNTAATALNGLGRYSEAYELLNSLGRNNWDTPNYNTAASALNGMGKHDAALNLLNSLGRNNWDTGDYNTAASALNGMGKHKEASELLDSMGWEHWNTASYHRGAIALKGMGKEGEALLLFLNNPYMREESIPFLRKTGLSQELLNKFSNLFKHEDELTFDEFNQELSNLKKETIAEKNRGKEKDALPLIIITDNSPRNNGKETLGNLSALLEKGLNKKKIIPLLKGSLEDLRALSPAEIQNELKPTNLQELIKSLSGLNKALDKRALKEIGGELIDAAKQVLIEAIRSYPK